MVVAFSYCIHICKLPTAGIWNMTWQCQVTQIFTTVLFLCLSPYYSCYSKTTKVFKGTLFRQFCHWDDSYSGCFKGFNIQCTNNTLFKVNLTRLDITWCAKQVSPCLKQEFATPCAGNPISLHGNRTKYISLVFTGYQWSFDARISTVLDQFCLCNP